MPFSAAYRAEVEEKLGRIVPIESKVMFGGVALYSEGLLFALIDDDKLYFKVSDLNRGDFEAAGMSQFYPSPESKPMNYFELPPGLIDRPGEIRPWIDKSLDVARAGKAKRKPKVKP
jgi:DNA transformation protein